MNQKTKYMEITTEQGRRVYHGLIDNLPADGIFVFGSNIHGIHGAGTASIAKERYGAILGVSMGLVGNTYGIVTVADLYKKPRPSVTVEFIIKQIAVLYEVALMLLERQFFIAYTGSGSNLSGFTSKQLAAMFAAHVTIPENIIFEKEFAELVDQQTDEYKGCCGSKIN